MGCYKEAALKVNDLGIHAKTSARTAQNWNVNFRKNCEFPHHNPKITNGMKYKPSLFDFFPSIELDCKDFIFGTFDNFHVKMLRDELITTNLPRHMTKMTQDEQLKKESEEYKLLEHLTSNPPAYSTVLKWMHAMGFKRDTAKKCYYVDGHEKTEQQKHRSKFLHEYLKRIEHRCHRWFQLNIEELNVVKGQMIEHKLFNTGSSSYKAFLSVGCQ